MALGTAVGIRETAASSLRTYFEAAADRVGLQPEMRNLLSVPFREVTVELPLRRDDGRLQLFRGYRVQHNGVRGPVMGGVRIQSGLDLDVLRAGAESMTWRCAVANVPFGGAGGGISCDTAQLSHQELERLVRRYTSRIHHMLGIYQDICMPGTDAGSEVMAWIADEHASLHAGTAGTAVGRPSQLGGLPDSDAIRGRALAALVLRAAHDRGLDIDSLRVVVKSLDQTAIYAAMALVQAGCAVVGISEERGAVSAASGIDVQRILDQAQREGVFGSFESAGEMHKLDCDMLAISGIEGSLNGPAANQVRAKLVIEASELVISPSAERTLAARNVLVIPDLVGAAATVLAANTEWSSNAQKVSPSAESAEREITKSLLRIYEQVVERSLKDGVSLRTAAYCSAIEKVARAERLRVA